ncbi:hypothetical protein JCM18899A_15550 [Nocardioides sp. AN3]
MSEQLPGILTPVDEPGDAELISAVRAGDLGAYGLLFERHVEAARRLARQLVAAGDVDDLVSEAFTKVLAVLQRGGGPDLAFRAYLLTSVRRLHVDKIRGGARLQTTDDLTPYDPGVPFEDTAVAGFENATAAKAFASLPERWQQVLWHTEVEGQKPAEIAPLLGISANSVSALAYRAREGLRQAFVTMHAQDVVDDQCATVRANLGAYLRGGLSRRDAAKLEAHLQDCRPCTAIYLELAEVNADLGAVLAPILLGSAGAGYLAAAHVGALSAAKGGVVLLLDRGRDWLVQNPAGRAVGGVAAAAAVTAAVVTGVHLTTTHGRPTASITSQHSPAPRTPGSISSPPAGGGTGPGVGAGRLTVPDIAASGTGIAGVFGATAPGTSVAGSGPGTSATGTSATGTSATGSGSAAGSGSTPGGDPTSADGAPRIVHPLEPVVLAPGASSVTIDVTRGAVDPDGDPLHATAAHMAGAHPHGTVTVGGPPGRAAERSAAVTRDLASAGAATVTYEPQLSWRGTETIVYVLADGRGGTVTGTVEVTTPNRPPVARADTAKVHPAPSGKPVTIAVLANDTDANHDALTVTAVTAVSGPGGPATVTADGRQVSYHPPGMATTADVASFHYTVSDGHGGTATARVTVTFGNSPPTAGNDRAITPATGDRSVTVAVLANDGDPDGDPLRLAPTLAAGPAHGTVTRKGDSFLYTPDRSFPDGTADGTDSFRYTVTDGFGGTATATVTVTVVAPSSDLSLTAAVRDNQGEGVVRFAFTAGGIPPARHARFTAVITDFGEWNRLARVDGGPSCARTLAGTTMTLECAVNDNGPFLEADFHPKAAFTIDARLVPVDFVGSPGVLHRSDDTMAGVPSATRG